MGVMRRKLFYGIVLSAFLAVPAHAGITVEETTDPEYLINTGYSQLVAEDAFMLKNRAMGKPIEPLYETSSNKFVRLWRKFHAYVDPALDAQDRLHHDIKPYPSATDL